MKTKKYYHITSIENMESILQNGIKANNEGHIFLFENKSIQLNGVINTIADCIAFNQIFIDKYAMFEIKPAGLKSGLINDNVGEFSSKQQWILEQNLIEPKYIDPYAILKTNYKSYFE